MSRHFGNPGACRPAPGDGAGHRSIGGMYLSEFAFAAVGMLVVVALAMGMACVLDRPRIDAAPRAETAR